MAIRILIGVLSALFLMAEGSGWPVLNAAELPEKVLWTTEGDFKSPESAAFSETHETIFVSNVNGYERNGKGFISRLLATGEIQHLVWLDGLNAPTGLAVQGQTLWAVDFDHLLEIDIPGRRVRDRFPAPDERPLLNDVAVTGGGDVFVTGSASNTVYRLSDGRLVPWVKDDERLAFANGITATRDEVVVAAYHLVRISRTDKSMAIIGPRDVLYDLEGVKPDGAGGYYVSLIGNRPVMHFSSDGHLTPMFKGRSYVADFDLVPGVLVAPTGPQTVTAFVVP